MLWLSSLRWCACRCYERSIGSGRSGKGEFRRGIEESGSIFGERGFFLRNTLGFDLHEAARVGALHLVQLAHDVLDRLLHSGDEGMLKGIHPASCFLDLDALY